jgi:hypothetical protein
MILCPYHFSEVKVMLQLEIKEELIWNPRTERFDASSPAVTYYFEHSLKAISKWESYYVESFFECSLTPEQTQFYIQCMEVNDTPIFWDALTTNHYTIITDYIAKDQSATKIKMDGDDEKMIMTTEILYAMMAIHGVPFECDEWPFSRLNKLLQTITFFKKDKKKMSKKEIQKSNAELNAQRRKELNTKG